MSHTVLGIDIGSSSIKGVVLDLNTGEQIAHASSPASELEISAPRPGWAEQHPDLWWEHLTKVIAAIRADNPGCLRSLKAIGIAYQMHGLVLIDNQGNPVRPAIIWCDSRAVAQGDRAFAKLGPENCLKRFGNSPGNFTASKLAWVSENEPELLSKSAYFMLPGDYIAFKLTGEVGTTRSGLSEGVLWDFSTQGLATAVLDAFGLPHSLVPPTSANVGVFAPLRADVANELGLPVGVPVSYRAGDQPNNALALNALLPGEVAANAGTSGVVYGVTEQLGVDSHSRVNSFLHVNDSTEARRIGVLMCVNGTGSFYRWVRATFAPGVPYQDLNNRAETSPIGANGLIGVPYGNGAERTLDNLSIGASFEQIDLNRHTLSDIIRATQEGIVFALCYGVEIMRGMGLTPSRVRAGNANMFQSPLFQRSFANALDTPLELYSTDGAAGAARGAAIGAGLLSYSDAFKGLERQVTVEPDRNLSRPTQEAYERWKEVVSKKLKIAKEKIYENN